MVNKAARHRYAALDHGTVVGYAEYKNSGDSVVLTHTEVMQEGKGGEAGASSDQRPVHVRRCL